MTTINPSTPFFKWKMAIVTKTTDDWTLWNCDETYERTLFIGIHDDLEQPYAALYLIYKGTVQPAAGNAILADLLALQTSVNTALQELQALIDQVNATSASMQELWQKVNNLVVDMEDKLEAMQEQIAKARVWAEGTDAEVTELGGQHSSKTWAGIAKQAADLATGAAFPILEDGDQGKALVVNDAADGYELTAITADAAEYSANRIVRTAHEQQNLVCKYYSYSAQIYIKAGVVGWVPNGGEGYEGVNTMDKIVLTPTPVAPQTVIMNDIASDSTVTAAQDLAPNDLPVRDYWALGDNKSILFTVASDGSEIVGFAFDETAWVRKDSLTSVPRQFYYIFDPSTGKAWYTKDTGATWVQCSLPFMRFWFTQYANRDAAYAAFGSVLMTYFKGTDNLYYWLVPPFDCCMAMGGTMPEGVGVDIRPQMRRLKVTAPMFLGRQPDFTTDNYGNKLGLWISTTGDVVGGETIRTLLDSSAVYDAEPGKARFDDVARPAAIEVACCPNHDWWGTHGGDYTYSNPMIGRSPDYIQTAPGYAFGATDIVRSVRSSTTKALSDAAIGTIVMENNNGLRVYAAYRDMDRCAGNWRKQWLDISPAAPGASNTFTATNTFKSWTYFEGETYVRNGGYMQAQGASYFLVPDFSRAEDSEEARYEAVNRKTLQDSLATREPINTGVSLSTPSSSPFAGKISVVGSATLDDATGIATGFSTGSYLKFETAALDGHGYDMIFRVMQNGSSGRGAILSWDSSDGNIANTEAGLQDTTPYTFQNTQTLCTVSPTLAANAWNWVRFKKSSSSVDVYVLADSAGQYTLDTLPALDSWVHSDTTGYLDLPSAGRTLYIGRSFVDSSYYLHGSIDMYNTRITLGDTLWYDGAALAPKSYSTVGTHQQSTGRIADGVILRRFEANDKTYMELDGMFTGTVAADNTISISTSAYGFKGTLISLQATPLGTGSVTVNYNSTTATDMENGTITLRTSIAAGETFGISLHCVIEQSA